MRKAILLIALILILPAVAASGGATVSISSPSVVLVGSEFYVNVSVSDIEDFDSADYSIRYEPSLFELKGVYNGSVGGKSIPLNYSVNNSEGICRIVQHMGLQAVSGSGYLSRVKFICIGEGKSYLALDGNISDTEGNEIDSTWLGKNVTSTSTLLKVEAPDAVVGEFNASILIRNATAFSSINMTLSYDDSLLYVKGIGNGHIGDNSVNVSYRAIDGSIKIAGLLSGTSTNKDGCIANITFMPRGEGIAFLNISDVTISNASCSPVTAFIENKSLLVESTASPPVANFSWTPEQPSDIDIINFNASSSYDIDGFITNYTWNFGDGNTSYGSNATHTYADNGNYTITLTVTDNDGLTNVTTINMTVENIPPVANFTFTPSNPKAGDEIHFTDKSNDSDGFITNYTWNFGDGNTSYGSNATHTYADNGNYTITLTVTDNDGATGSVEKEIIFSVNHPPYAPSNPFPSNGATGVIITPTLTWQCDDIDGDSIKYDVYFGTTASPSKVGSNVTSPSYNPGVLSFQTMYYWKIVSWDSHGARNVSEIWHFTTKANSPPAKPSINGPSSGNTGSLLTFRASSTDPDGDKIKYGFDWNGDGIADVWSSLFNSGQAADISHSWSNEGTFHVRAKAQDEHGAESGWSDEKTVVIQPYSPPPRPLPPAAGFSFSIDNLTVSFKDESSDSDGYIVNWTWNFGDGNTSYEKNPWHVYSSYGNYTVKLIVTDNDGLTDKIDKKIVIQSPAPPKRPDVVIETISMLPPSPHEGDLITFTIKIVNKGNGDSNDSTVTYSMDGKKLNSSSFALPAGESIVKTFSINASDGDHLFKATVSYGSNENGKSLSFHVSAQKPSGFPIWIVGVLIAVLAVPAAYFIFKKVRK